MSVRMYVGHRDNRNSQVILHMREIGGQVWMNQEELTPRLGEKMNQSMRTSRKNRENRMVIEPQLTDGVEGKLRGPG
jgi:hypothetical protein